MRKILESIRTGEYTRQELLTMSGQAILKGDAEVAELIEEILNREPEEHTTDTVESLFELAEMDEAKRSKIRSLLSPDYQLTPRRRLD